MNGDDENSPIAIQTLLFLISHALDAWSFFSAFIRLEITFLLESEHAGPDILRKSAYIGIEIPCHFVETHALRRDPVFHAFVLGLEIAESLDTLELGIVLGNSHQTAQCTAESTLGFFKLLDILRGQFARIDLDAARSAAGFHYGSQCCFFKISSALYDLEQVGGLVHTSLVSYFYLLPLCGNPFIHCNHVVIRAAPVKTNKQYK